MAVSGHLLVLLVPVLSLCGATEYYVRPTEPTNTSCPAQPCLTLSQYTSDSDHYFKSNTVFKFLSGTHHMDRPLTIGNVHSMSLESLSDESDKDPHLVAQFSCETEGHECIYMDWYDRHFPNSPGLQVCCAAIWLHEVYNVTVKGISITVQTSDKPISVVTLKNVSGTTVQLNATCPLTDNYSSFGIIMYEATSVEVHSSSASNCSVGLFLQDTTNTNITKVTAMYNEFEGITLSTCMETNINNSIAAHNGVTGMDLNVMRNTNITNMTTAYNGEYGMTLNAMSNTHITNMTIAHNGEHGMHLYHTNNTHITNTIAMHHTVLEIYLWYTHNTHMTKITAKHNAQVVYVGEYNGQVVIDKSINVVIYNTSFTDQSTFSSATPTTLPAVIVLCQHYLSMDVILQGTTSLLW